MPNRQPRGGRRGLAVANSDVVAFALYEIGGAGRFVEIEDLFLKCYELAPRRFSWRTKSFPNYKTLYQALVDCERAHPEVLLKTKNGMGRQLSAAGVEWVLGRRRLVAKALAQSNEGMVANRPRQRMLNEFLASAPMRRFVAGDTQEISRYEAADLLVASPDSPPAVWRERLATYRSAAEAAGRSDVQRFLDELETSHREWFTGTEG